MRDYSLFIKLVDIFLKKSTVKQKCSTLFKKVINFSTLISYIIIIMIIIIMYLIGRSQEGAKLSQLHLARISFYLL